MPPLKDDRPMRCAVRLLEHFTKDKTYTSADKRMIVAYQRTLENYGYPKPINKKEARMLVEALKKLQ